MKRIYISLPITGYDYKSRCRFAAKVSAEIALRGDIPVNPLWSNLNRVYNEWLETNESSEADETFVPAYKDFMKSDLKELLECDAICLCEGWEGSRGCQCEATVGKIIGLDFLVYDGKTFNEVDAKSIYTEDLQ